MSQDVNERYLAGSQRSLHLAHGLARKGQEFFLGIWCETLLVVSLPGRLCSSFLSHTIESIVLLLGK